MDYWIWSVSLSSIGSTLTGIKFAATIYRNRAPGMALCRYLTRPALAEGRVRYTLKTPYRDGATHVVFAPLWFRPGATTVISARSDRLKASVARPSAR